MLNVALLSAALNFGYLIVALTVGWFVLLALDRRLASGKGTFNIHFGKMQESGVALALYLGLRFLGLCVLVAAFLHG